MRGTPDRAELCKPWAPGEGVLTRGAICGRGATGRGVCRRRSVAAATSLWCLVCAIGFMPLAAAASGFSPHVAPGNGAQIVSADEFPQCLSDPTAVSRGVLADDGTQALRLLWWPPAAAHTFSTHVMRILARERLGYTVELVVPPAGAGPVIFPAVLAGCNEVDAEQCCTADAASITTLVDCNGTCPHSCPASAPSPASSEPPAVIDVGRTGVGSQAVLDEWREAGLVQTAGTLGLLTRPSLYLTPAAWDMVSSSDHSSDAAVAALRHRDVIKMLHQPLENATISALAQGNCEDGRRPWEAGCRNGWYHAPPCDPREGGDPAYCFTILAGYPADAAGLLHQLVTNLGLNASVAWLGDAFPDTVAQRQARGGVAVTWEWTHSQVPGFRDRVRIAALRSGTEPCRAGSVPSSTGPTNCDVPLSVMGKVYWPALTEAAPAAAELVRSLRFEPDDVEEQLDDAASTSLDAVRFPLPLAACAWVKRHGKRWDDWILPLASCTESNTRTKYSGCFPHGVSRTKTTEWLFPRAGDPSQPADCAPDGFRVGTEEIRCPYLPPASPLGVATHIVVALCSFAVALCLAWLVAVAELPKRLALMGRVPLALLMTCALALCVMSSIITLPISLTLCYTFYVLPGSATDALLAAFLCLHGRARRRAVAVERAARSHRRRLVAEARGFEAQRSPHGSGNGQEGRESARDSHGSRSASLTADSGSRYELSGSEGADSDGAGSASAGAAERGRAGPDAGRHSGHSESGHEQMAAAAVPGLPPQPADWIGAARSPHATSQGKEEDAFEQSPRVAGTRGRTGSLSSLSQGPSRGRTSGLLGPPSRVSERPSDELLTPAAAAAATEAGAAGDDRERPLKRLSGAMDPLPPESSGELARVSSEAFGSMSTGVLGEDKSPEGDAAGPGTPTLQVHTGSLTGAGPNASRPRGSTRTPGAEAAPARGQRLHVSPLPTSSDGDAELDFEPGRTPIDVDAAPLRPVEARYQPSGATERPRRWLKASLRSWFSGMAASVSIPASLATAAAVGVIVLILGGLIEVREATDPWGERFKACKPTLPALVVVIVTSRVALRCFVLAAWLETLTALPKSRLPRGTTSALPVLAVLSLPSAFIDHAPTFSSFVYRLTVSVVGLTLTAVVTSALLRPHARAMVALRCKSPCGRRQEAGESLPQTLRVKADEISLEEPLGAGSFGEVFRGRWRNTQVAVKKLRSELSEAAMRGFASEATLMQGLRHPNIVLFMALSPSPPLIVLEYMSRGSLYHALHSQRVRLSWHARLRMLADAAAGMAYLHQHQPPIVHLDLKSPNLLLDDSWRCKVSDFGQSKLRRPTGDRARQGGFGSDMYLSPKQRGGDLGSVLWSAPEAFQGEQLGLHSDVYSFGVVLFEMLLREVPFKSIPQVSVALQVTRGVRPLDRARKSARAVVPPALQGLINLMSQCWDGTVHNRPTMQQVASVLEAIAREWTGKGSDWQTLDAFPNENDCLPPSSDSEAASHASPQSKFEGFVGEDGEDSEGESESEGEGEEEGETPTLLNRDAAHLAAAPPVDAAAWAVESQDASAAGHAAAPRPAESSVGVQGSSAPTRAGATSVSRYSSSSLSSSERTRARRPRRSGFDLAPPPALYTRPQGRRTGSARGEMAGRSRHHRSGPPMAGPLASSARRASSVVRSKRPGRWHLTAKGSKSPRCSLDPSVASSVTNEPRAPGMERRQRRRFRQRRLRRRQRRELDGETHAAPPVDARQRSAIAAPRSGGHGWKAVAAVNVSFAARDGAGAVDAVGRRIRTQPATVPSFYAPATATEEPRRGLSSDACAAGAAPASPPNRHRGDVTGGRRPREQQSSGQPHAGPGSSLRLQTQPHSQQQRQKRPGDDGAEPQAWRTSAGTRAEGDTNKQFDHAWLAQSLAIDPSKLRVERRLGKGSVATVYRGSYQGTAVAIKRLVTSGLPKRALQRFEKECEVMALLRSPHIVLLIGVVRHPPNLLLVSEFMALGDVMSYYRSRQPPPVEHRVRLLLRAAEHVARGMCAMHGRSPPLLHRDLKSPNVFVSADMQFKVGDFGLSRLKDANGTMTQCGSPLWAAPELLRNEKTSEACDVYAYGVFLWELAAWQSPFAHLDPVTAASRVAYEGLRPHAVPGLHAGVWTLITACWAEDPAVRPTFEQVLHWLASLGETLQQGALPSGAPAPPVDRGAAAPSRRAPGEAVGATGPRSEAPDPFIHWILSQAVGAASERAGPSQPASSAAPQQGRPAVGGDVRAQRGQVRMEGEPSLSGTGAPLDTGGYAARGVGREAPLPERRGAGEDRRGDRLPGEDPRQWGSNGAGRASSALAQSSPPSRSQSSTPLSAVRVTAHGVAGMGHGPTSAETGPQGWAPGAVGGGSGGGSGGEHKGQPLSASAPQVDASVPLYTRLSPPPPPLTLQQGESSLRIAAGPQSRALVEGAPVVAAEADGDATGEAASAGPPTVSADSQPQPLGMPILYEDTGVNGVMREATAGMGLSEMSDQFPATALTGTVSSGGSDPDSGASVQILAQLGVTLGPSWAARTPGAEK